MSVACGHGLWWDRVIPRRGHWVPRRVLDYGSEGYRFNSDWVRQYCLIIDDLCSHGVFGFS